MCGTPNDAWQYEHARAAFSTNFADFSAASAHGTIWSSSPWNYQDFAVWMTDTTHDAGDPTQHGTFRQMTARARLGQLFGSPTAARLHTEYQLGLN